MSAMRAEDLPELPDWLEPPAAVPPDSAQLAPLSKSFLEE